MVRVGVLIFSGASSKDKMMNLGRGLGKGLETQGAQVEIIDFTRGREVKLTAFHYIVVGCDVRSLFKGKLPHELSEVLASAGNLLGKKSFAFVPKAFMGAETTLLKLMSAMEKEGMMVQYSEIFARPEEAQACGGRLQLS